MAIPDILAVRLIETVSRNALGGRFLMLGRQDWIGKRRSKSAELLDKALEVYLPGVSEDDLRNTGDKYSETFFFKLGFETVDSLDYSGFEGASIVQDLGGELDPALEARFDVIYDGGTCEHVFDLPTAYRNIDRMLKPGGVLIAHSPANNWINHGFYQITPEIVYGFWSAAMGYEILHCELQPLRPYAAEKVVTTTNPLLTGKRPRLKGKLDKGVPVILNYGVRKPEELRQSENVAVKQTDYAKRWE